MSIATKLKIDVANEMLKMLEDCKKLPVRATRNQLSGTYGRTQRDVVREFKSYAKNANLVYRSLTNDNMDIWDSIKDLDDNEPGFFEDI